MELPQRQIRAVIHGELDSPSRTRSRRREGQGKPESRTVWLTNNAIMVRASTRHVRHKTNTQSALLLALQRLISVESSTFASGIILGSELRECARKLETRYVLCTPRSVLLYRRDTICLPGILTCNLEGGFDPAVACPLRAPLGLGPDRLDSCHVGTRPGISKSQGYPPRVQATFSIEVKC